MASKLVIFYPTQRENEGQHCTAEMLFAAKWEQNVMLQHFAADTFVERLCCTENAGRKIFTMEREKHKSFL